MKKQPVCGFRVESYPGSRKGHLFDSMTTFYENCEVIAQYFYLNGQCNYLISWGFEPESLGEHRARQCRKKKKPFFSLTRGYYE